MAASSMIYRSPLESGLILWLPSSATCLTCRTTSSIIRSPSSHNHHLKVDVVGNYEIRKTASGSRGAGMQTRLWSDKDRAASKKGHLNGSNTIAFFFAVSLSIFKVCWNQKVDWKQVRGKHIWQSMLMLACEIKFVGRFVMIWLSIVVKRKSMTWHILPAPTDPEFLENSFEDSCSE